MNHFFRICGIIIISTFSLFAQKPPQQIRFSNITSSNGLSQNTVNCIIQDNKGFVWIGTANGLNRYNGYQFKIYKNEQGNENSLSNNYVVALYQDRKGYIWIGTFGGGVNRFNPDTEEFVRYQHRKGDVSSIASNDIRAFYEDEKGKLWLGLYGGDFSCFDSVTQKFERFPVSPQRNYPNPQRVFALIPDKNQGFWVGTTHGLFYFDRQKKSYTRYFLVQKNKQGTHFNQAVYSIFRDRVNSNILWLCTLKAGLIKFDTYTNQIVKQWTVNSFKNAVLNTNRIMSFHQDKQGTYWVGTQKGFYKFDPQSGMLTSFPSDPQDPRKISGNVIQQIFEDKAGTLWLCSFKRGISTFNPYLKNY